MATLRLYRGLQVSDVSGYLMISAKSSCHTITCESIPGSPPPFLFFSGVRGGSGNEASVGRQSFIHRVWCVARVLLMVP